MVTFASILLLLVIVRIIDTLCRRKHLVFPALDSALLFFLLLYLHII
jgi:hypothetical protein